MFQKDTFYWINQIEKASTLMTLNEGIITQEIAKKVAIAIKSLENSECRPTDYIDIQPMLLKLTGSEGSMIHVGRSRQDILATIHRLLIRDRFIYLYDLSLETRKLLIKLASENFDTIVPSYTNGVQAQPVTLGHLLSGYEASIKRASERLREFFPRLNKSPLGSAALAGSSFPINRVLLADFLGFNGCVENSFDAAQLSIIDIGTEVAYISSLLALSIGTLIQDIHIQFHHVRPWLLLSDDSLKSASTLMPQKRNPVALNRARLLASEVTGDAFRTCLSAHNVNSGLTDYKRKEASETLERACNMLLEVNSILKGMDVDKESGLEEVKADYSTTTELANVLQRKINIPFKIAHEFSSLLVTYGRKNKLFPFQLPFNKVIEIFDKVSLELMGKKIDFSISEGEFFEYLDPLYMINNYSVLGGSNPEEVKRILINSKVDLAKDTEWLVNTSIFLKNSEANLSNLFDKLISV
ncbi:lyase family protein [Pasteurella testudinis]|uniref:lyase family protein n=1 Tax=Pasteurella testudinis TaxID=761 RepID=UPI004058D7EF